MSNKIQKHFDEQKEFICCSKGCSKCCLHAQFPYSEIEFRLLSEGFYTLTLEKRNIILSKINNLIKNREEFFSIERKEPFRYECPFLINNECSVYNYRGLVCRTFGLMTFLPNSPKTPRIPFCAYEGLNYSKVLDVEQNNISKEKYKQLGLHEEPIAYNVDYATLLNEEIAQGFGFKFGEVKPLIEWFLTDNN